MGAKETDITGVLVGVLVVMVAGTIVSLSNQFLQTKTTSKTEAKMKSDAVLTMIVIDGSKCKDIQPLGLMGMSSDGSSTYSTENDICLLERANNWRLDSLVKCTVAGVTGMACQRNGNNKQGSQINLLGNKRCISKTGKFGAICRLGQGNNSVCKTNEKASSELCGLSIGSTYEVQPGTCCIPNEQSVVLDSSNCGAQHIDCTNTFVNGADSSAVQKAICVIPEGKTSTDAKCMFNNMGGQKCNTLQYASPIYYKGSNGVQKILLGQCAVSLAGKDALGTVGGPLKVCDIRTVSLSSGSGQTCASKAKSM